MTLLAAFILLYAGGSSQATPEARTAELDRRADAVRLEAPIVVDGVLSEAVWNTAPATTTFTQRDPNEGAPASEQTEVRFAYDDEALYVGARLHDSEPRGIVARLGRRDDWLEADAFVLYLDPYHDRRSGVFFSVNAAGTLWDGTLYNDDWDDNTWDGVWEGRARVDEAGWSVELRIPFSELRFHAQDATVFGVNCRRYIARKKENLFMAPRPKKESGFVSRFAELHGLTGLKPPRRASITPYATARAEFLDHDAADPFNDGSRYAPTLGADAKLGLGSNLTLDLTLNPDFGQVEVDPAVVNLSDVETFFEEKRPFFIEGSSLFQFGFGGASNYIGFNWAGPDFFYSRRIGRFPQGATADDADFTRVPQGTTILGAGKLTGKLGEHWNVAMLHAVTSREFAQLSTGGTQTRSEVEPAAYYGVLRAQREFPDNRYGLGVITTFVGRDFAEARLEDELNARSLSFGVDGWAFLDSQKRWVMTGWTGLSSVHGTAARISDLQQSSQHYFQRPDADRIRLDPSATSLQGRAGRFALNKEKGNVLFNAAVGFLSPGFDTNDIGFLWRADMWNGHLWGAYRWTDPGRFARSAGLEAGVFRSYDFDGNKTRDGVFVFGRFQALNYWTLQGFVAYNPSSVSTRLTRGGPRTLNPKGYEWDLATLSDERKKLSVRLAAHGSDYARDSDRYQSWSLRAAWRPAPAVSLSVEPRLERSHTDAQYVDTFDDPLATSTFGQRYLFARLDQRTFSAGVRLNWTFTPRLSLQLYAQPLIASGGYTGFGQLARPQSYDFERFSAVSLADAVYTADPDGVGPAPALEFDDPNFNFRSLRGNAVLRWEFRPGSTAYFVWTQNRSDEESIGSFEFSRSWDRLLASRADHIFLVKFAYRFAR